MKLIYRAYDRDTHRYMTDDEVRIAPSGQVYYNIVTNGEPVWAPLPKSAEWLVIEKAVVLYDGRSHEHSE